MEAEPKQLITSTVGDTNIQVSVLKGESEQDDDEKIVTLTREGSQPITLSSFDFDVLYTDPDSTHAPNMIVGSHSGGAHCCYTLHIISFAPSLHQQDIEANDADLIDLQAVARGGPTLGFFDFNFASWNGHFGGSPAPPISLSWDALQGLYVLNVEGMRKPAPSNAEREEAAKELLKEKVDTPNPWPPTLLSADRVSQ